MLNACTDMIVFRKWLLSVMKQWQDIDFGYPDDSTMICNTVQDLYESDRECPVSDDSDIKGAEEVLKTLNTLWAKLKCGAPMFDDDPIFSYRCIQKLMERLRQRAPPRGGSNVLPAVDNLPPPRAPAADPAASQTEQEQEPDKAAEAAIAAAAEVAAAEVAAEKCAKKGERSRDDSHGDDNNARVDAAHTRRPAPDAEASALFDNSAGGGNNMFRSRYKTCCRQHLSFHHCHLKRKHTDPEWRDSAGEQRGHAQESRKSSETGTQIGKEGDRRRNDE